MESNKEESQKCLRIAQAAFDNGDIDKAKKFLVKSNKLYPLESAKELDDKIQAKKSHSHEAKSKKQSGTSHAGHSQSMPDFSTLHGSSTNEPINYTPQQKQLADRINGCKDFYDILGVSQDATDPEMKKAYRKMALQLHPDKNSAPGATEAFKAVGKAFAVLSDAEKRKRYDMYGPDDEKVSYRRQRRNSSDGEEYDNEFDPQEFFNMFFGGGFPSDNVRVFRRGNQYYYQRGHQRHREDHGRQQANNGIVWIQLLPILIIFVMTMLGNLFVPEQVYSLHRKSDYIYPKTTANLKVSYHVKSGFGKQYPKGSDARKRLEDTIEADYVEILRTNCYQERVNKENTRRRGIYFGSQDLLKKAEQMNTPSCEQLEKLFKRTV